MVHQQDDSIIVFLYINSFFCLVLFIRNSHVRQKLPSDVITGLASSEVVVRFASSGVAAGFASGGVVAGFRVKRREYQARQAM